MSSSIVRTARSAAEVRRGQRDWFRFRNADDAEQAELFIYDEIGWFGIMADDFRRELAGVTAPSIALKLNSPGGDVFDGIAIYNLLQQHSASVNVTVDGIAASIASVIAMAGERVEIAKGALMMIHEPFGLVIGDANDMRKQAEALDKMGDSIAGIYAARAGGAAEEWRARMADETWFDADEAVEAGLADAVTSTAAVENRFNLSIFRNGPKSPGATPPAEPAPARSAAADSFDEELARERLQLAAAEIGGH